MNRRQRRATLGDDARLPYTDRTSTKILAEIKNRELVSKRWRLILEGGEQIIGGRPEEKTPGLLAEYMERLTDFRVYKRQCEIRKELVERMAADPEGVGISGPKAQAELELLHMLRALDDKEARFRALEEEIADIQEAIKETAAV